MKKLFLAIPAILAITATLAFGASSVLAANSSHGSSANSQGSDDIGARFAADVDQLVAKISAGMAGEHFGQAHFTGKVESIKGDVWMISGKKVDVDSHTNLVQSPKVGDMVLVNATVQSDGSFLARVIKTITSSEEGNEHAAVVFTGKVTAISGSDWTVDGKKVVTDSSTRIIGSPVVNDMVQVVAKPQSDGSFLALVIRKITPEEEEMGQEVVVTGKVVSFSSTSLVVGSDTFTLDSSTDIDGKLADGVMVRVEAVKETDGTLFARGVQVLNENGEGTEVGEGNEDNEGSEVGEAPEAGESMEVNGNGDEVELVPGQIDAPLNPSFIGVVPGRGHGKGKGQ